ncbi:uncharacterized protein LOC112465514 [Temnothorax curvispinosus]|uniref:Uncharacterized protein LOC112465514 n=1 Tax=Temnothorax curvispinosus TaxID=300111 RepID=A0A6J1R7Q2_9HYME|nr:uncharacterized protein LOC112465514 [Temnothorax curvispinosus]
MIVFCFIISHRVKMQLHEFLAVTHDKDKLMNYLIEHNVISNEIYCPKCNNKLKLNRDNFSFRCRKALYEKDKHKKYVKKQCTFRGTVRFNTWFSKSKLSLETICRMTAYFIMLRPPRLMFMCTELQLSQHSVVDWISFCREVCIYWAEKNSTKLGGPNIIVEIDEAKIGKRKYNRGRIIDGKWIFGGYERGTKKIFIVPVQDRTEKTLLELIKEWILPGTTIMSDCWKSYNCLNSEGFQHLTVNHSMNFVDPDTGAHTQNIERVWREVRANIPRYGTRSSHLVGYLAEYLFKRVHAYEDRLSSFFRAIADLYPPKTVDDEADVSEAT